VALTEKPAANADVLPGIRPTETHWSRILYCDILNADEETFMAPEDGRDNEYPKTPTESALVLLAIYIALYLSVAGLVHIVTSPHANAAVAPSRSAATASTVAPPSVPVGMPEPAAKAVVSPTAESIDDPHECNPRKPFDSNCMYD